MNRQYEYRQALDSLHFTDEQKTQIARRAAQAAEENRLRRRGPVLRTALTAAVLAAVLMVSAGATGLLKSAAEAFAPIFGGDVAQTEIIDKIGRPIGACDTDNGVTITADAIIGDQYNAAIVYTIRRDDGTPLLPEGTDARSLLMGGFGGASLDLQGGSYGGSWFVTDEADDSAIQMVQAITSDRPIIGCTAAAEFEDLCVFDDEAGRAIPLVEGHWKFRFDVVYEDTSVTLGNGETFEQDGLTFTVDAVTVSPIAVQVAYTVDRQVVWSDAPSGRQNPQDSRQMELYMENVEILLTKTDGTVVSAANGGSIKPEQDRTVCTKGGVFDEIIPLEELASISVGGIVYPISGE